MKFTAIPLIALLVATLLAGTSALAQDTKPAPDTINAVAESAAPEQDTPATIAVGPAPQPAIADINEAEDSGPHPDLAQDYTPSPAIWLLSDIDTKIYLFGTYHALPPGFEWRTPLLSRIIKSVDELVLESSDEDMADPKNAEQLLGLAGLGSNSGKATISARISPENSEKWETVATEVGLPVEMLDAMAPMAVVFAIEGSVEEYDEFRGDLGVETILTADFQRAGKPIGSIENSGEVMQRMLSIDDSLWVASLDDDLTDWDGVDLDTFFSNGGHFTAASAERQPAVTGIAADNRYYSEHMWAKGLGDIDDMAFGDGELGREFRRVLLEDRNRAWSVWLDNRLDRSGTLLVAVGSAHFGGHDSVLRMLEARGLAAKRIN